MQSQRRPAWFRRYDEIIQELAELQSTFESRSAALGVGKDSAVHFFRQAEVARAVHESNWQEGIYLESGRTTELTIEAYREVGVCDGPQFDIDKIVHQHEKRVADIKREKKLNSKEIAALNLSTAHLAALGLVLDFQYRWLSGFIAGTEIELQAREAGQRSDPKGVSDEQLRRFYLDAIAVSEKSRALPIPLTVPVDTPKDYVKLLVESSSVPFQLQMAHIHALHRIMGAQIIPRSKLGSYRKTAVSVGFQEVLFPPPEYVPGMMAEFCAAFPLFFDLDCPVGNFDPSALSDAIMKIAKFSYRFAFIHPYVDGNGRVSRLLMNLMLALCNMLPTSIAANSEGRGRYLRALKMANRNNLTPLACLIALSLCDTYRRGLEILNP